MENILIKNLLKDQQKLQNILRNWKICGYRSASFISSYGGDVLLITLSNGRKLVLKDKINLEKTKRDYLLLSQLHKHGIPVSVPLLTTNNECCLHFENHYYWLYPYISGKIIKRHYTRGYLNRASLFGEAVGKLHLALKKANIYCNVPNVNIYNQICTSVANNLRTHGKHFDLEFINSGITSFKKDFMSLHSKLPVQLIHRDIHPSNMIYKRGKIVGYIDFEIVQRSIRIYDICYCATSILVGGFKSIENRKKWLPILKSLLKGYSRHMSVKEAEQKSIYYVLLAIQLLFMSHCVTRNLKASLYNEKVLKWLVLNRDVIEKYLNVI